jgi:hypothetical protein
MFRNTAQKERITNRSKLMITEFGSQNKFEGLTGVSIFVIRNTLSKKTPDDEYPYSGILKPIVSGDRFFVKINGRMIEGKSCSLLLENIIKLSSEHRLLVEKVDFNTSVELQQYQEIIDSQKPGYTFDSRK